MDLNWKHIFYPGTKIGTCVIVAPTVRQCLTIRDSLIDFVEYFILQHNSRDEDLEGIHDDSIGIILHDKNHVSERNLQAVIELKKNLGSEDIKRFFYIETARNPILCEDES